jgi:hypothetical protein
MELKITGVSCLTGFKHLHLALSSGVRCSSFKLYTVAFGVRCVERA